MENQTPPIEVEGLRYHSRGRAVLHEISFSVARGEIVVLAGPNQSGKSAIARILAGEVVPSGGEARVLGRIPWDEPQKIQRQTGYLPERDLGGEPDARVVEYLLLAARLKDIPRGKRTRLIDVAMKEVRISRLLEMRLGDLSRGERRRVFLAQALLGPPRVLILDSPFEGMDARSAQEISSLLRGMSEGKAILVVTTRLGKAAEIADRLLILMDGRLVASGPPSEIAKRFGEGGGRELIRVAPGGHTGREELLEVLKALSGVEEVLLGERADGTLAFTVCARHEVRGEAVAALVARGAKVLEVREMEGRLRDAYRALTSVEE